MCNACGFGCCAWDGFDGCGCEDCPNPECWSEDYVNEMTGQSDDPGLGDCCDVCNQPWDSCKCDEALLEASRTVFTPQRAPND